jgi:TRAP-type C4-dicarboxylate transport system permease small subunit
MDEYNSGMDPEVRRYFKKIMNSFSFGLMWLLTMATAGIYFELGFVRDGFKWYNIIFYSLCLVSFIFLIRYLYKTWKDKI